MIDSLEIIKVLDRIYNDLIDEEINYQFIPFSLEDINTLSNTDELRALKFMLSSTQSYGNYTNLAEIVKSIRDKKDYYLLLKYCTLRNHYLDKCVRTIFEEAL